MKYAHCFKAGKVQTVQITDSPRVSPLDKAIRVFSRADAKRIAKEHNAKPYNF